MIRRAASHLDVIALDGRLMCCCCGERPAVLEGRYCCKGCRRSFFLMGTDPDPDEIRRRCHAIIDAWSPEERAGRAKGHIGGSDPDLVGAVFLDAYLIPYPRLDGQPET